MGERLGQLSFGPIQGGEGDAVRALELAAPHAPYLASSLERRPDVAEALKAAGPDRALADVLASLAAVDGEITAAMRDMRRAKLAGHMIIAGADLAGLWTLDRVVEAITALAETATQAALRVAVRAQIAAGRLPESARDGLPGYFLLAMGKMGARELNYSSDIDLIALFDPHRFPIKDHAAKDAAVRLTRDIVRIMEERTVDGYVFRTDLRLRPDPNSTAIAVSTEFATGYYESVGQNWERMAHIKARVAAGDQAAGADYLAGLEPYVWRRHLDYWAISDIHSIKRQIHSTKDIAQLDAADFNIKLGRGGIREIEFFAQVQQLILGGRSPALRCPRTKDALAAMVRQGVIAGEIADDLSIAYDYLRALEHRVQMLIDEQTHRLPPDPATRAHIAALSGYASPQTFEADLAQVRQRVHGVYSDLFAQEERLSSDTGNLVFTGVDDDPGTVETLRGMGFSDPSRIIRVVSDWHRGSIPATRSPRGRQLLTVLGPRLLQTMSDSGEPDQAFDRFNAFFSGLAGGVQVMSMMQAEPKLTRDLIETMAFAPQLAHDLGRRPALLETMLDPEFREPITAGEHGERESRLRTLLKRAGTFEDALNAARRFHREEAFRIGYQLLRGMIHSAVAGEAYADLADACIAALADVAEREVQSRYSGSVGRWAVCGLGKLGGRELSASSDLDLMLIYERPEDAAGESLAPRFVQRLIAALSAPTEEGALYEVDTQLRPSGRAGPVAVKLSSFESYYRGDAWTWEFMALTRLRPVAGDDDLRDRIVAVARDHIASKSSDPGLTADVLDMRRRLARDKPAKSRWDLKQTPGGLIDIEFIVQHAILKAAGERPDVVRPGTRTAIDALAAAGQLSADQAARLRAGLDLQLDLQQGMRIASGETFDPDLASPGLKAFLARLVGQPDFAALQAVLAETHAEIANMRDSLIGPLKT